MTQGTGHGNTNRKLTAARRARRDEFYTTREVVEDELQWYADDFRGRPVLCNCNDWPRDGFPRSEFVRFFMRRMAAWDIPRLVAVGYRDTVGTLFEGGRGTLYELVNDGRGADRPYTESDFRVGELEGSGGFDTPECEALLDIPGVIVCTNPPFSEFRRFLPLLDAHGCGFLVLGNINAVTYKEVFPLFMRERCWLGVSIHSGDRPFHVPDGYEVSTANSGVDDAGHRWVRVNGVRWFTNLPSGRIGKNALSLEGNRYDPAKYPRYDNYDAINVDRVQDIPEDWYGEMGVPITFLDKWAPEPDAEREREREDASRSGWWGTSAAGPRTGSASRPTAGSAGSGDSSGSSSDVPPDGPGSGTGRGDCGLRPSPALLSGRPSAVRPSARPSFGLIDANLIRRPGTPAKATMLIKDGEASIGGRVTYARLVIRRLA